jgi:poly-gamma-glutamate capsule biosynthesis protein CapA/YwtB (metallophosphatase superfamily)
MDVRATRKSSAASATAYPLPARCGRKLASVFGEAVAFLETTLSHRRRPVAAVAAVLASLLALGCGIGGQGAGRTAAGQPPATPTPSPGHPTADPSARGVRPNNGAATSSPAADSPAVTSPAAPPAPGQAATDAVMGGGRTPSGQPVILAFGGDVHFEGVIRPLLADPATALASIEPVMSRADIAVVNLETAITERGTPAPKQYLFRAPASAFAALRAGGVKVATMANNHGMDYGVVGLQDSMTAAAATNFPLIGIGADAAAAYAPYRVTVHGQRIAIVGATQVLDENLISAWTAGDGKPGLASAKDVPRLIEAVREARRDADTVVVDLHWGTEQVNCPTPAQRELAPQLIAAGADAVVGSHAHVLLGAGYLDGAYVDYGLGNFVFYASGGPGAQSGVLTLTVRGRAVTDANWTPAMIAAGVPRPLTGDAADAARQSWAALRGCTDLTATPAG